MSQAETYAAPGGRPIALVVRSDFDDFASHPPTFENEAQRDWLREHYNVASPEIERDAKAHLTPDEQPLQVTLLNRLEGSLVKPHYHTNDERAESDTRHQVVVCMTGALRIGLYAKEGDHVADVDLAPGDFALLYEGHSIETLQDGSRMLEVKQGPMPSDPYGDNIAIREAAAPPA